MSSSISDFNPALVVFDKDGTLIDFHAMWGGWTRDLAGRLEAASGWPVTAALMHAYGYDGPEGQARADSMISYTPMADLRALAAEALLAAGCPPDQVEPAMAAAWHVPDPVALARPLADLPALFGALRARGARLAVCTGDDRAPTLATLAALDVAHLVDAISCGDDGLPTKPSPLALLSLCRSLDVAPNRAVVVGDTPADMQMGRAAGAGLVVGVLSGASAADELAPHADRVIASIAELL
jgi:phosphoglycolate phosphatase-like HAD superfamily hydrolase